MNRKVSRVICFILTMLMTVSMLPGITVFGNPTGFEYGFRYEFSGELSGPIIVDLHMDFGAGVYGVGSIPMIIEYDPTRLDYVSSNHLQYNGTSVDMANSMVAIDSPGTIFVMIEPSVPSNGLLGGHFGTMTFNVIGEPLSATNPASFEYYFWDGMLDLNASAEPAAWSGQLASVSYPAAVAGNDPVVTSATPTAASTAIIPRTATNRDAVFNLAGTDLDQLVDADFRVVSATNLTTGTPVVGAGGTTVTVPMTVVENPGAAARPISFTLEWNDPSGGWTQVGTLTATQAGDMPVGVLETGLYEIPPGTGNPVPVDIYMPTVPAGGLSNVVLDITVPAMVAGVGITIDDVVGAAGSGFTVIEWHMTNATTARVIAAAPVNFNATTPFITVMIDRSAATSAGGAAAPAHATNPSTSGYYPVTITRVVEAEQNPDDLLGNPVTLTVSTDIGGVLIQEEKVYIGDVNLSNEVGAPALTSRDVTLIAYVVVNGVASVPGFGVANANTGCFVELSAWDANQITLGNASLLARYLIGAEDRMCSQISGGAADCTVGTHCNQAPDTGW